MYLLDLRFFYDRNIISHVQYGHKRLFHNTRDFFSTFVSSTLYAQSRVIPSNILSSINGLSFENLSKKLLFFMFQIYNVFEILVWFISLSIEGFNFVLFVRLKMYNNLSWIIVYYLANFANVIFSIVFTDGKPWLDFPLK